MMLAAFGTCLVLAFLSNYFDGVIIYWGALADAEGLAISITLGQRQTDVPSRWHALRMVAT